MTDPAAAPVVVVLVEPAGARNLGSVARLCANFGIAELRLVAPRCDPLGEEARLMAVHAADVLERAAVFNSLAEALADCQRVVATSGRGTGEPLPLLPLESALAWLLEETPSMEPAEAGASAPRRLPPRALVFGREDRGLSNAELLQAGRLLLLETAARYSSLNLSHAAAVVLHGLHRQMRRTAPGPDRRLAPATLPEPCRRGEMEALLSDAEALLLDVGFLLPHTAHARLAKLRALLQRAQASSAEVALLRGMVRQLRWASQEAASDPGRQQGGPPSVGPARSEFR